LRDNAYPHVFRDDRGTVRPSAQDRQNFQRGLFNINNKFMLGKALIGYPNSVFPGPGTEPATTTSIGAAVSPLGRYPAPNYHPFNY
jgi:hypothetical protein